MLYNVTVSYISIYHYRKQLLLLNKSIVYLQVFTYICLL